MAQNMFKLAGDVGTLAFDELINLRMDIKGKSSKGFTSQFKNISEIQIQWQTAGKKFNSYTVWNGDEDCCLSEPLKDSVVTEEDPNSFDLKQTYCVVTIITEDNHVVTNTINYQEYKGTRCFHCIWMIMALSFLILLASAVMWMGPGMVPMVPHDAEAPTMPQTEKFEAPILEGPLWGIITNHQNEVKQIWGSLGAANQELRKYCQILDLEYKITTQSNMEMNFENYLEQNNTDPEEKEFITRCHQQLESFLSAVTN